MKSTGVKFLLIFERFWGNSLLCTAGIWTNPFYPTSQSNWLIWIIYKKKSNFFFLEIKEQCQETCFLCPQTKTELVLFLHGEIWLFQHQCTFLLFLSFSLLQRSILYALPSVIRVLTHFQQSLSQIGILMYTATYAFSLAIVILKTLTCARIQSQMTTYMKNIQSS